MCEHGKIGYDFYLLQIRFAVFAQTIVSCADINVFYRKNSVVFVGRHTNLITFAVKKSNKSLHVLSF